MSVRVRFAPSPTGYLHVGGLRTALYNYLYAKKRRGKIILRIEDTDQSRYVENAEQNLIKSLRWAGIEFDESPEVGGPYGPYRQSERLDIYKKHADILIGNGSAYYAFDTPEDIDNARLKRQQEGGDMMYDRMTMKNQLTLGEEETQKLIKQGVPYVIRLKVPKNKNISFNDLIRGEITVNSNEVDDQVLMKSDGFPTYHMANVVDDKLMKISHVIRGEEWLPSTPKHVLLYEAFGWEPPCFAHLPLLLNEDKSKLSKRQGSVAVEDFKSHGYFRDAFINFIALLGWNPTGDREIYTINELINFFDLSKVNKGGAVFDVKKLEWMNSQYMKTVPTIDIVRKLKPYLDAKDYKGFHEDYLKKVADLLRERVVFVKEIPDYADYMFEIPKSYDEKYMEKHWTSVMAEEIQPLVQLLKELPESKYNHDDLNNEIRGWAERNNLRLKDIVHPLRLMITGKSFGAGMFQIMEVLGKQRVIERIEHFLEINKPVHIEKG